MSGIGPGNFLSYANSILTAGQVCVVSLGTVAACLDIPSQEKRSPAMNNVR